MENSSLEPDMMVEKSPCELIRAHPPNVHSQHSNNTTGSSLSGDENNLTTETVVKFRKHFLNLEVIFMH